MIKKIVRSFLPSQIIEKLLKVRKQARNFKSLAKHYGQWQTIRDWDSVDQNGDPIPWYTYPTTEFLSRLDLSNFRVFEYGSGNSTLWWASRAKQVASVENDEAWYEKIKSKVDINFGNVTYKLVKDKQTYYSTATNEFDVFIVDGKYRRECIQHLVNSGEGLMIVLDNSDWYPRTVSFIQNNLAWVQIDFHGFGPINDYTWTTTIFINPARHHELVYRDALKSVRGLIQVAEGDY